MNQIQRRADASQTAPRRDSRRDKIPNHPTTNVLPEFVAVLDREGLHDALGYLNRRVRFRFTGLYRFEPTVLVNECLYDRENPTLDQCGTVLQLPDTYCAMARALGRVFQTQNAPADPRLQGHSARHTVISYNGMPIRMKDGLIAGVLCHYDLRPRLLPEPELRVLESAAAQLGLWLKPSFSAALRAQRAP